MPLNNINKSLKSEISQAVNEWLEYQNGLELRFITSKFNIDPMTNDKYDYVSYMDSILFYCNASLENSINILQFINNEYK